MRIPTQTQNTISVQMKNSDIHRLLTYDQSSTTISNQNYFCQLPATLLYPQVTRADLDAYLETIGREYITPLDLQTWQHMQLFLLEPEWLQGSTRRKLRARFYDVLRDNHHFIHNIIDQYSNISLFSECVEKQEALFFTVCGLLNVAEQTQQIQHSILQYKNSLLQEIKASPIDWVSFIKGADWLLEELQQDSGLLITFLQQVSVIPLPMKEPTDMVQEAMAMWVESASNDTLKSADQNLNRINDMLRDILSDIADGKRPTNKT